MNSVGFPFFSQVNYNKVNNSRDEVRNADVFPRAGHAPRVRYTEGGAGRRRAVGCHGKRGTVGRKQTRREELFTNKRTEK